MDQNRLKSPVVWAAVAAQILALLVLLGVIGVGMSDALNAIVVGILEILTLLGVFNNPTNSDQF